MEKNCDNCQYAEMESEQKHCNHCINFNKWKPNGTSLAATHYQIADKQPIEIIQMYLTPMEFQGYLRGNVIKYILRCGHKDEPQKEIEKSIQYSKWLIEAIQGKTINPMDPIKNNHCPRCTNNINPQDTHCMFCGMPVIK